MYIPNYFRVKDADEIRDFIEKNSFGTIVTIDQGKPVATHLPLLIMKEGDTYCLTGHMAYGNPQWKTLETCGEALVMFQGPHAYISSSWYEKEEVPTWNYQAVHAYGSARILEEEELKEDLVRLLEKYEGHRENPVLWDTLSPEVLKQQAGIVGFRITVREFQAADKLSQNRSEKDYHHIIDRLNDEADTNARQVAEIMKSKRNPAQ